MTGSFCHSENYSDKITNTSNLKQSMEIKIRHKFTDTGFCCEVWETELINERHLYFGHDTVEKSWCILYDAPDGFCEPGPLIGKHVTLIICDDDWNEFGRDGNDREKFPDSYHSTK